jgi:hypothetical protein
MQCSVRDKGRKENTLARARLCLDGVLSLGEVDVLLLLLLGDERRLVLGESSADGAGLLGSEVEGKVPSGLLETSRVGEVRPGRTSCPCRRASAERAGWR